MLSNVRLISKLVLKNNYKQNKYRTFVVNKRTNRTLCLKREGECKSCITVVVSELVSEHNIIALVSGYTRIQLNSTQLCKARDRFYMCVP